MFYIEKCKVFLSLDLQPLITNLLVSLYFFRIYLKVLTPSVAQLVVAVDCRGQKKSIGRWFNSGPTENNTILV